jgi:hypothetical protein
MPHSGGCERPYTDAFITNYNDLFSTSYVHKLCLDQTDSSRKQPEVLYEDTGSNHQMVIERKSIAWPSDYSRRHHIDHWVGQIFESELRPLLSGALYELHLPSLMAGTRAQLRPWVISCATALKGRWQEIESCRVLGSPEGSAVRWWFRKVPEDDKEEREPEIGLKITLSRTPQYLDSHNLPPKLGEDLQKIYDACTLKFVKYPNARRILLLEPMGDLEHNDSRWWSEVFANYQPPEAIDQIWTGSLDYIDETILGWTFERLRFSSDKTASS